MMLMTAMIVPEFFFGSMGGTMEAGWKEALFW